MRNRITLWMLAVFAVVFLLVGCSTEQIPASQTPSEWSEAEQTQAATEAESPIRIDGPGISCNPLLPNTYKVPMENIYIEVPDYKELEEGMTEVFIVWDEKYVAVTSHWDAEAASPAEAHTICLEKLDMNMDNYKGGINSLRVDRDEIVTINGIEMYHFEGAINYGRNEIFDGYAVGYAFILNGIPCEIVGSVINESQSAELIEEITTIVDTMATSVRTEP